MNTDSTAWRKEAVKEYKERKPLRGAFAVRCRATGQVWVGTSRCLDTVQNRIWFGLGHGGDHNTTLQAEWNAHGQEAFEYEILEQLEEDVNPLAIKDILKEKLVKWAELLGARRLI